MIRGCLDLSLTLWGCAFWWHYFHCMFQGPPGPAGLQGPVGAPGPAVSTDKE